MLGMDGRGPTGKGPLTGGRRGLCAGTAQVPGHKGGYGWRNQFYATGLTGWQRAAQTGAPSAEEAAGLRNRFARLETALDEVLERLERIEAPERK
jgi:hypothetical protein